MQRVRLPIARAACPAHGVFQAHSSCFRNSAPAAARDALVALLFGEAAALSALSAAFAARRLRQQRVQRALVVDPPHRASPRGAAGEG